MCPQFIVRLTARVGSPQVFQTLAIRFNEYGKDPLVKNTDRHLPNEQLRILMDAIEIQMGSNGLRLMLRNAKLDRYIDQPPPRNRKLQVRASEYTQLLQAMRSYLGVGARGTLLRVGRDAFRLMLAQNRLSASFRRLNLLTLSEKKKGQWILSKLATDLSYPDDLIEIHSEADRLVWVDPSNDRTVGIQAESPICWTTVGVIAGALLWATSKEHQVVEQSCIATGDDNCTFIIHR